MMLIRDLNGFQLGARDGIEIEIEGKNSIYEIRADEHGRISIKTMRALRVLPRFNNVVIIQEDPND